MISGCFFLQSHTTHVVCKKNAPSHCLKRVKLITFFLQISFCRFFERKMLFTQVKNDQTSSFKSSPVKYFARKALKTRVKMRKSLPPFSCRPLPARPFARKACTTSGAKRRPTAQLHSRAADLSRISQRKFPK